MYILSKTQIFFFKKKFFFQTKEQPAASNYSDINSSEGSIGKRNCKLWYKYELKHIY